MIGEQASSNDPFSFLAGGGEMGERIRSFDWSKTPLGPIEHWSLALRTTLRILLANRFPHVLWWGPQHIQLYNDAYRPVPGAKHPDRALGQAASECWAEIWHVIGPLIDRPFHGGPAAWDEDILLEVQRHGFTEECHFTIAYSPVPDETAPGGIGGVIGTIHEITAKVIGERRTVALRDLAARAGDAKTAEEACAIAARVFAAQDRDVPFALLYLVDADGRQARLAGAAGVTPGEDISPAVIDLDKAQELCWLFGEAVRNEGIQLVERLSKRFRTVPPGPWSDPPDTAVILPISSNRPHEMTAVMVAGVSARLKFDTYYRDFLELAKRQVATAIANARSYEEERKRSEALAELDRAKTAFFSNVSHEFRTPLTLMLGPIEEMLRRSYSELSPAAKVQLEIVNRNGLRLMRLVNTLLDFSRIEAGRVRAIYQPTDLASFTADLASVFRAAVERAGLRLEVDCPALPEPVYVDRDMWEKIVLNLLSNAFKFTLDGEIVVTLRTAVDAVELRVADTGTGIPAEEMPRLFERFHRVKNAYGRTHEGSGIGLALVHELVRLHGGTIAAESAIGRGTTFTIRIPTGTSHLPPDQVGSERRLTSSATGPTPYVEEAMRWLPDGAANEDGDGKSAPQYHEVLQTPARGPANGESRPRVLVADDNADMRQYITRLLGERYQVEAVANGQAALLAAKERKPDLILTDVMMPRLDGFGLLHEVRADAALRETPFIMLSARAGEESRVEGMDAGADDYLVKPFSARELIARVEAHLKMALMRREAAERASYRTAQFEILVDRAPVGIFLVDADLRIRHVNPIGRPVFGDIDNLVGGNYDEVIHRLWSKEYADEIVARFRHTLETGESYATPERAEYRIDRNTTEYYEWRIDRTLLPDGQYGVVCYFRDISAQVVARQELEASREVLRRDARRKSEFLSILAHELRNPLAPITNSLELLNRVGSRDPILIEARDMMQRQLSHMVRLVDDLLDMSRITRDKLDLRRERVDLVFVISQSIESCRAFFNQYGHRLDVEFPSKPIYLDADPVRLAQVFQNLLNNACKYMEAGGVVCVNVEREGDSAVVSVRDTGVGIPPTKLSQVFEMFSQVHSGEDRGGLGIGLALVRRLVEMHKGTVEARSEGPGKGAEFVVRLPALDAQLPAAQAPPVVESVAEERDVRIPRRRILIVDDNEDSAESTAQLLELSGHHVLTAHDGPGALEAVERFDPQIILLDIGLPKMDGYEVCRAIRREGSKRRPFVIAVTGWGQNDDRYKSMEAGFDYHLVKPVAFDVLMKLLMDLSATKTAPASAR